MTDAELLRAYVERRAEDAFAQLVDRHVPLVYGAALRQTRGDAALAQDVTQQVFLALARKARLLTRHASLTGWLYTAARLAAKGLQRGELRRHAREQAMAWSASTDAADARVDWDAMKPLLDEAMHSLNDPDRELILLRFFQSRSLAEAGRTVGISENAAQKRINRALDRLRRALARRGLTSTAAALSVALQAHGLTAVPAGFATKVVHQALVATGPGAAGAGWVETVLIHKTAIATVGFAAGCVVAVGLWNLSEYRELGRLRAALPSAQARSALADDLARAQARLSELTSQAALNQGGARAAGVRSTAQKAVLTVESRPLAVANQKALAALMATVRLGQLDPTYSKLFSLLVHQDQFTPAQLEQFKTLLVQREDAARQALGAATEAGLTGDEAAEKVRQAAATADDNIRAALGGDAVQELHDYMGTLPQRNAVSLVQSYLQGSGNSLTETQTAQLIGALSSAQPAGASSATTLTNPEALSPMASISDHVVQSAAGFLSAPQLETLRKAARYQARLTELNQIIQQQTPGGASAP